MDKKEDKFLEEFLSKWIIICINGPIMYILLKISDYTNTVREEIEGSSELRKMIQRNLDKMNEEIGDIDMSEKQKKTWLWLAGYEESTIDNILDVIKQKRR